MSAGKSPSRLLAASLLAAAAALYGCLSNKITGGRQDFYAGNYPASAKVLSGIAQRSGKDRILALLEYGTALQAEGKYKESTESFLEADRLIEANDIISVSQKAKSAATNKMTTTFRPESFERGLLHTYLQINYILMDNWSDARVEAKKALEILDKLDSDLKAEPFTRYVCGLSFEVMGDLADAYIEYSRVIETDPGFLPLYYDLYRIAAIRGLREEAGKWARSVAERGGPAPDNPKPPNLIVFVGAGRSPIKREINMIVPPSFNRFVAPDYRSSNSLAHHAVMRTTGYTATSFTLTDLNPLAEEALKKRLAKEIAAEVASLAAKEVIARQIEKQNALLGLGVRAAFWASEKADTRSWETLPRYFGVLSYSLPPGIYQLDIEFYTRDGAPIGAAAHRAAIITEGRRTVLTVRSVR